FFFFSSRRRHTRFSRDWSSDVCSSDLSKKPKNMMRLHAWRPIGSATRKSKRIAKQDSGKHWVVNCRPDDIYLLISQKSKKGSQRSEERRVGKESRAR